MQQAFMISRAQYAASTMNYYTSAALRRPRAGRTAAALRRPTLYRPYSLHFNFSCLESMLEFLSCLYACNLMRNT